MHRVYLDYAASHPLSPEAQRVIEEFAAHPKIGNPSSLHAEGRSVQALLDKTHTTVGAILGVDPTEVVFTSGATESNTMAIKGGLAGWRNNHKGERPHVILSAIEHPSVRNAVQNEDADVTTIAISSQGVVKASDMLSAIRPNTALISCMYVNNEIGTIQPIPEIGKGVNNYRQARASQWPIFHVDAVQAFPYLNTHSGHIHADIVTYSGHKYGTLQGIGVATLKKGMPFQSLLKGGGQEWGFRAGTENVLGALTLAAVMEWDDSHQEELLAHTKRLQSEFEGQIIQALPHVQILGSSVSRAPHITYVWLPGIVDESLVQKLDLKGVSASSGSACSSGAMLPSFTLMALGYDETASFGGIRFSFGRFTTKEELKSALQTLKEAIAASR